MNSNTSGALLLVIIAAAGLVWGSPAAVWLVLATCALAFLAEQVNGFINLGVPGLSRALVALTGASWLTALLAALSLAN